MVIFLYGLSGAGKSTLAVKLQKLIPNSFILDGDIVREGLCSDLGFSKEDRSENLRRVIHCARLLSKAGVTAIAALIAPYEEDRRMVERICHDVLFIDVFVSCPLDVCEERDVKGLYKKARAKEIANFTGVSDPFETPLVPLLVAPTNLGLNPSQTATILLEKISALRQMV
jgi:adenylylsulfate kinase